MASTVLIVEDDPHVAELARLYLNHDDHNMLIAGDGATGLKLARETQPDLLVLDLMLPGMDGLEVCRIVREESAVPIIMLTARVEEEGCLAGLDLGADDYMTKPFSPRELAARVKAVLRRTGREALEQGPSELSCGPVRADLRRRMVTADDKPLHLTPTEFRLLITLMRDPGRVFSRDQIIDRAFGDDFQGFDRTVDAHISSLRRKLEAAIPGPRYIHTVYGFGYRFGDA